MNTQDAAYHTVHDHPGGSPALAPRVGMSAAMLRNKVNPNNKSHHLTFAEAQRVVAMTGDVRMLRAWAHQEGFLLVKVPEGRGETDMSVLEGVVETGMAHGYFMQSIYAALADGKVDTGEVREIRQAERTLQTAAATVTMRMAGMAEK